MAKQRKSIFEVSASQAEISEAAKKVQKEAIEEIPAKKGEPTGQPMGAEEKLMHLYVDTAHHRQAKIGSTLRGMKLGEYIEWLIDQDKGRI